MKKFHLILVAFLLSFTSYAQIVLPLDFESTSVTYSFTDFAGGAVTVIPNAQANGINTSSKVAQMVKSVGQTYGGSFISLTSPIDFSVNRTFKMKVFSPRVGAKFLLKVENEANAAINFERQVVCTVANQWEDLTFDFSAISTTNQYQKMVFIFDNGTMGDGTANFTYLFDDVRLVAGGGGPSLTQMNLPVTFDLTTVDYGLIGFGGAEQSSIVTDPTNASNKVAKVIKSSAAELWAGTTVTAAAELGFSSRIPFTASNTKMSVRVWSPNAGIQVRLKVEEHGDPTHSVETEATVTTAAGWQTLEFNFANQAAGTAALNLGYNYDKASIFFNFGITGAAVGEKTYYFDDMQFGTGGGTTLTQMNLPVTFDLTTVDYGLIGFGGAEQSSIVTDPTNASNKVAKVIKSATAELWAGTTVTAAAGLGFATRIPFTASNTKMSVRVWSPNAGIPVRLKAEDHADGTRSVETEATVTLASGWQTLEFNFANQSAGTSALNLTYNYDKVSIFFNFGTTGAVAGEKTYYFDDVQFVTGGGGGPLTQMNLPVTFDLTTVDYGLIGFGGAEQSSIVTDPTNASNKVAKVIKSATAELWAGTTVTAAAGLGFATRIPFTASNTKMSVRVWSPNAGIPVRLKAEDHADGTRSVETEATVTLASGWQTLEFNFANQSAGTSALNLTYNYDKVSVFFNFGTTGAVAGEKTYYFDDVEFVTGGGGGGGSTNPVLPLDFQSSTIIYTFNDFDGGGTTVINNPQSSGINTSSKVAKMVKSPGQPWGGSWIALDAPIDFSTNRTFKMKVYSPRVGAKVLLKVENMTDAAISFEKEVLTTTANAWEDLTFNYSAISTTNQYQKLVFIFDNGTIGDGSANFTFLFDDVRLTTAGGGGGGGTTLTQMNLPVNFDLTTVEYGLIGFGGAEQSSIVTDPTNATNKVAKVIKSATAEVWAGTTITAAAGLGFSSRIPFTANDTKMTVRVWSPQANIPVRLKVEDHTTPTHSVETETMVTVASGWQILEFNFAQPAQGTATLNLSYNYDKASIFFNFGTSGATAGEQTYYFDDVKFATGGGLIAYPELPLDFQSTTISYSFIDFDGGSASVIDNPQINGINNSTKVARMVKNPGQVWGGSLLIMNGPIDFSVNRIFKMKVYSPRVGAKVLLKAENLTDGSINFEKEAITTVANTWEELSFDFNAINITNQYQKLVFIFENGTVGDGTANFTFLFDDVKLVYGNSGNITLTQMDLPLTFDQSTVDYGFIGFNGAEQSSVVTDPTDASNKVGKVVKSATASADAGTVITAAAGLGFVNHVPFTVVNTDITVRVWAPEAGIPVRLKLEDHTDATHYVETEATVSTAAGWQTLAFNFANQVIGTPALNLTYNYDMATIYFNYGTTGATAGEKTYYFDDMQFVADAVPGNPDDVLNNIVVYPNPFVSDVYIRNVTLTPLDIRLSDAAGRILGRYTSSVSNIDINMSKYPSGVYFISVENKLNNKNITKKVIKK